MVESSTRTRHLRRASVVVALSAAAAACYLLLVDASSSWFDWIMGGALGVFTLYGATRLLQRPWEEIVPAWRARAVGDVVLPLVPPLYLGWWAEDRGSRLEWLGWGLLATAVVIQVVIWRQERFDGELSTHRANARYH